MAGRDQRFVGEDPREIRWTVTAREGKDSDSNDSRKYVLFLFSYLLCRFFSIFFHFFFLFFLPLL